MNLGRNGSQGLGFSPLWQLCWISLSPGVLALREQGGEGGGAGLTSRRGGEGRGGPGTLGKVGEGAPGVGDRRGLGWGLGDRAAVTVFLSISSLCLSLFLCLIPSWSLGSFPESTSLC